MQLSLSIKRPALRWHGAKFRLAPWIISHFPEHVTYCEPFGGSASVLLRKTPSNLEIYNDLDSDAVNFFRLLRNPETAAQLARAVALTPFSREEFRAAFAPSDDPIERARRLVVRAFQGFASHSHNILNTTNGFRTSRAKENQRVKSYAREWLGIPDSLRAIADRFSLVTLEHVSAFYCIPKYDSKQTLHYVRSALRPFHPRRRYQRLHP